MPPSELADLGWGELFTRVAALDRFSQAREWETHWAEIATRVNAYVRVRCRRYSSPGLNLDADDITQDLLVKLQRPSVLHAIVSSRNVAAYMAATTRFAVIDAYRRAQGEAERLDAYTVTEEEWSTRRDASEVEKSEMLERSRVLGVLLEQLSENERQLIQWRYIEDRDIGWIARQLDINYSAAAVRLFRVVEKLRQAARASPP